MARYSLLKAYPIEYNNSSDDNHIFIHALADNRDFSVAINVCSNTAPRNMFYTIKKFYPSTFTKKSIEGRILKKFKNMKDEFKVIKSYDFFTLSYNQAWFNKDELMMAESKKTPNNQLGKEVVRLTKEAIKDPDAYICAYGMSWGPKKAADRTFGFYPTRGIHDVHCNKENGHDTNKKRPQTVHDGALFFWIPSENCFYGIFCMFPGQY